MDTDPGYALAAAVLRELDADEMPVLPGVWAAYWRRPVPPRELPGRDHVIGGGVGEQLLAWAPLVVAYLGSEVLLGAAADAAKDNVRSGVRNVVGRLRGRKPEALPATVVPELTADEISAVARKAEETALALGEPPERAKLFADAMAGGLARRAEPPAAGD